MNAKSALSFMLWASTISPVFALPFPVDSAIPNFSNSDMTVLMDLDDIAAGATGTGKFQTAHLIPRRIALYRDPDSGRSDFSFMPSFDEQGQVEKLIVDFSLTTELSDQAMSALNVAYPDLKFRYYPIAKTSSFDGAFKTSHVQVLTLSNDPDGETASNVMNMIGQAEPLRLVFDKSGLNQYRCALDIINHAKEDAKRKGIVFNESLNALSVVTGKLVQSYRAIAYENLLENPDSRTFTDFKNYPKYTIKMRDGAASSDLDKYLAQVIRRYKPSCDWNQQQSPEQQIKLGGFKDLLKYIAENGLEIRVNVIIGG